jgi:glycosyltransferase involved in cell wall biosynthesis
MDDSTTKRVAFWFRYGPAEHAELFHALPELIRELSRHCEVHYFGYRGDKPIPAMILENAVVHHLPWQCDRQSPTDKFFKTILWVLLVPWMGLRCRSLRIDAIWIDDTIPLTSTFAQWFFGRKTAFTVADFFVDIYLTRNVVSRALGNLIRRIDLASWRKLPLIFTRAKSTRSFLAELGVPEEIVHPVYDPCDFDVYHPGDRRAAREKFGYAKNHFVLVHHGILHPNKGNEFLLRALAPVVAEAPHVRFLLVGDGPDMSRLRKVADELDLNEIVTFTGWLPHMEDVNLALNTADVGLVMRTGSRSDDFHMTGALVHNLACGLPILSARLGGVSELIRDGENGLLFDPSDAREFRECLGKLMEDPQLRREFSEKSILLARENFDINTVVQETAKPLMELVLR